MNGNDNERNEHERPGEALELTPAEKRAFETLPRERIPSAALEHRVVGALRDRGLLAPPRRRVIELTAWRIAAVAAACLVLLAAGFALGQRMGDRRIARDDFIAPETSGISVAAALQRAGSAYVTALQRFAALPDSIDGDQAVQGREVALATLYTAAGQVTRLVPKNEMARQLLEAINAEPARPTAEVGDAVDATRVIEF